MFKWWRHHSIFSTLTFFTFLIIFIASSQTWIKYLNFILLNEVIIMLSISIKFSKCTSVINTCLCKSDIVWKWEKLRQIDLYLLVWIFKQSDPNLTHKKAQKRIKEYYDTIKNKPDVEKLALEKITEWKHAGIYRNVRKTHYFLSGKNQNLRYQQM